MAQEKRHLTTEQLSALLDSEVTAEEQAQWEAHLSTCPQCQQELAGLRQTVTLLHALPQSSLPRSFMLSLEAARPVADPIVAPASSTASAPIPIGRQTQRRALNPYVRGVLRAMSTLAAVIGIVFLLSGVLPALITGGGTTSGTATSSTVGSSGSAPHIAAPSNTQHPTTTAGTQAAVAQITDTPNPTSTPTATATPTQAPQPPDNQSTSGGSQDTSSSGPTLLIFDLSSPAGRAGLGIILVILGLVGSLLFRRTRRSTSI